jgi:hypothetical protein
MYGGNYKSDIREDSDSCFQVFHNGKGEIGLYYDWKGDDLVCYNSKASVL